MSDTLIIVLLIVGIAFGLFLGLVFLGSCNRAGVEDRQGRRL